MFGARGRQATTIAAAALAAAGMASFLLIHGAAAAEPAETVRVEAGDTVWGIAERRYPESDPRVKVDEIMRLNGRRDPVVHPGESIKVPRR
jgi:nucleoid-associated protein YgaU